MSSTSHAHDHDTCYICNNLLTSRWGILQLILKMPRSDQKFYLLTPIIPYNKRANTRTTKTNVRAKKRTRARTTEPLQFSSASASCFKFNEFTEAFCTCFLFVNGDYDLNFTELTFSFHLHDTTCIWLYVIAHHGIRYGDQNLDTMYNEPDREGRQ